MDAEFWYCDESLVSNKPMVFRSPSRVRATARTSPLSLLTAFHVNISTALVPCCLTCEHDCQVQSDSRDLVARSSLPSYKQPKAAVAKADGLIRAVPPRKVRATSLGNALHARRSGAHVTAHYVLAGSGSSQRGGGAALLAAIREVQGATNGRALRVIAFYKGQLSCAGSAHAHLAGLSDCTHIQ